MILRHRTPGEPVLALALILAGWVGARVLAWEAVFGAIAAERPTGVTGPATKGPVASARRVAATPGFAATGPAAPAARFTPAPFWPGSAEPLPDRSMPVATPVAAVPAGPAPFTPAPVIAAPVIAAPVITGPVITGPVISVAVPKPGAMPAAPAGRIAVAGGHQLMWLAATAYLPMPPLGLRTAVVAPSAPAGPAHRWSGDGWLLLRRGDGTIAPGPVVGNYGASQMGAVLRYRLFASDPRRPAAYVRATAALNGTREQQVALGLSARPLPGVPVIAMAELRQVRDIAGQRTRPAAALVTELSPRRLPLGFTGELYAQAGYVGGRNPTAFIDGLVRAERPLADVAGFRLRAGGGAWGAKQRGAARLDVGPTASVSFRLTDTASARLAADWRFRVGGASKPDSGPALTLSAGF